MTSNWIAITPSHPYVLVLVLRNCAATVSSTGAENQFQVDDNGHVGRPCEVSLAIMQATRKIAMSSDSFTSTNTHRAKKSKFFFKVKNLCFLDKGG